MQVFFLKTGIAPATHKIRTGIGFHDIYNKPRYFTGIPLKAFKMASLVSILTFKGPLQANYRVAIQNPGKDLLNGYDLRQNTELHQIVHPLIYTINKFPRKSQT